jgi:gamma-glutamylcyclotransferase (GGCT)/AIG2-like uncharacterized protein YtfP
MRLFVYGTLRYPLFNNWRLDNDTYIGKYKTKDTYYMVGQISKSFPFVSCHQIFPDTIPTQIMGELYEVSPASLHSLDKLEGHPVCYERQTVVLDNGESAYMYLLESQEHIAEIRASSSFVPIVSGDWVEYCASSV